VTPRLHPAAPGPQLALGERGNRGCQPLRMVADFAFRMLGYERHADRLDPQLVERAQLEVASENGYGAARGIGRGEGFGYRTGVVDHVVEQLRPEMALDRQHVLEHTVVIRFAWFGHQFGGENGG